MPILIKGLQGEILTLLANDNDSTGVVRLITSVVGEIGQEDYFLISGMEAFTQNLSQADNAEFCDVLPTTFGQAIFSNSSCTSLTISY